MDQVYVVRHKALVEAQSIRQIAREMALSRNTVKRYLERAAPVIARRGQDARDVSGRGS